MDIGPITDRPFQVAVHANVLSDSIFPQLSLRCGGSIISKRSILTAAHCLKNYPIEDILIRVGVDNLGDDTGADYRLQTAILHPEFGKDPSGWGSDIAIMITSEDIIFSETVQPIKLSRKSPSPSTRALVSGFGTTRKQGVEGFDLRLSQVSVMTLDQELCKRLLLAKYKSVDGTQFCAADQQNFGDACKGDSGGPLTIDGYLVGIVSWGIGCGEPNSPGLYTDVYQFLDWIEQNRRDTPVALSGRKPVPITKRPFHAALYLQSQRGTPMCGGSIISKRSVLTAAHCLSNKTAQDILIRVGSDNLEALSGDDRWYTLSKYIIHENFDNDPYTKWSNDIAILIAFVDLTFGASIQPIPLSTESPSDAQILYISSYGSSQSATSKKPTVLTVQDLQKWSRGYCQQLLTKIPTQFPIVTSQQFCAVDENSSKDGCILDGGGPITTEITGGHLAGIASWEPGCDNKGTLTFDTDVASFADWIAANTKEYQ